MQGEGEQGVPLERGEGGAKSRKTVMLGCECCFLRRKAEAARGEGSSAMGVPSAILLLLIHPPATLTHLNTHSPIQQAYVRTPYTEGLSL
jgi:hypothetical protein